MSYSEILRERARENTDLYPFFLQGIAVTRAMAAHLKRGGERVSEKNVRLALGLGGDSRGEVLQDRHKLSKQSEIDSFFGGIRVALIEHSENEGKETI